MYSKKHSNYILMHVLDIFYCFRWSREDCACFRRSNEEHGKDESLCATGDVQTIRQAIRGSAEK